MPETYTGEGEWSQWISHFKNVAAVNKWSAEDQLLWLKVRLTGRAQTAFQRLSETASASYAEAKKALKERFEPASRKNLYQAEFQTRRKKRTEGWAEYAEDLKTIVDKAYPDLQDEAREQMALTHYLTQIDNPQVAFAVKQQKPANLDAAVTATLEMESYWNPKQIVANVETEATPTASDGVVSAVVPATQRQDATTDLMKALLQRMGKIELELAATRSQGRGQPGQFPGRVNRGPQLRGPHRTIGRGPPACWTCGETGHFARNCPKQTENYQPLA